MRAFLALPVLPPALDELVSLRARLRAAVAGVRWAPAESAHITLHFFGQIDGDQAAVAVQTLRPLLAARPPISLRLLGLGAFPSELRPRVLWCGVAGQVEALGDLADACVAALAAAGFAVERRPYRPHCTVGRPRLPWPEEQRGAWREIAAQRPSTAPFKADAACLYESLAGPAGVRHVPVVTMPMTG